MPVTVESVVKRYGPIPALRGLSMSLEPGEILGLVGPNGAGKSTLIKSIVGLTKPDRGRITVDGHPAGSPEAKKLLSYSPETPAGPGWATVCEILEMASYLEGYPSAEARRLAREAAASLGLSDLCGRRLGTLSKGQLKRVLIAQALVPPGKRYYLFDEPLTGLDPEWVARVREIISGLARGGAGVLVSSHILRELETIVDRVVIVSAGRTVFEGTLEELAKRAGTGVLLVVRTRSSGEAVRLLEQWGLSARLLSSTALQVEVGSVEEAEEVVRRLRSSGVEITGYEIKEASLEDAYLRLVGVRS